MGRVVVALVFATQAVCSADQLLPIFFMHGVDDNHQEFDSMQTWIRELDPDVFMYSLPVCDDGASYANLWDQGEQIMDRMREQIEASPDTFKDGYTLVAHSQGALTARTALQRMDDHRVHTFIGLAGPQMGEYGIPQVPAGQPLLQELANIGTDLVYTLVFKGLQAAVFQRSLSFANFWNDPREKAGLFARPHQAYLDGNTFLPVMNNDPGRGTQGPHKSKNESEAARYKANFLRLERAVFTAGTADDMILPYQSGVWDFSDGHGGVVPLNETAAWSEDWVGLRTMSEAGKLTLSTAEGVCHTCWAHDKSVFLEYIRPHLPFRGSTVVAV